MGTNDTEAASNDTAAACPTPEVEPDYNFAALVFGIFLILFIISGNLLVCLSVCTEKALKTTTNYFIVSLAVADLLLAILVLPLYVYSEARPNRSPTMVCPASHWEAWRCTIHNAAALFENSRRTSLKEKRQRRKDYSPETSPKETFCCAFCNRTCLSRIGLFSHQCACRKRRFQGGVWSLSTALCDALMTMDVMLCTASIFNLCAISVDRFIAVSIPLNYNRRQIDLRQLILISTTWIFAFAVASPVIFGLNNVPDRDPSLCQLEDNNYVVYSSICSFFIPCPVMLVLYCAMFQGLRRWEEARKAKLKSSIYLGNRRLYCPPPVIERNQAGVRLEENNLYARSECSYPRDYMNNGIQTVSYPHLRYPPHGGLKRKQAKINGRERKAMKVLPVVVGAFLFCWTPFFVVHITRALCVSCTIPNEVTSIVTWLGYVNSALNPIIYTVFNTEFRNFFRKVLHIFC